MTKLSFSLERLKIVSKTFHEMGGNKPFEISNTTSLLAIAEALTFIAEAVERAEAEEAKEIK